MLKKDLEQELNRTKLILDYARQDIDKKDKEIERLCNALNETIERNSKAIDYIESYMPNYDFDKTNLMKLLEILKGSDKE